MEDMIIVLKVFFVCFFVIGVECNDLSSLMELLSDLSLLTQLISDISSTYLISDKKKEELISDFRDNSGGGLSQ